MILDNQPFDLPTLLAGAGDLYAPAARKNGVVYDLVIEAEARTWVSGDAERVGRILGVLLSNAVKFTLAGKIRLYAAFAAPDRFRFVVSDTGIGFDAAFKGRMFDRFEQADSSMTRRFGGFGLGLAIAHDMAEQMGGELRADSAPGRGSTFVLDLPLTPCDRPATVPPLPLMTKAVGAGMDRPTLCVLMADDHPVNRRVVELILEPLDVSLTSTENGLEAVEAYRRHPFDLVLMDLQMPVMDGLEAIRRIRADEACRSIAPVPIVVLTASASPEHRLASHAAGATAHLTKPIEAKALIETVESVRHAPILRGAA